MWPLDGLLEILTSLLGVPPRLFFTLSWTPVPSDSNTLCCWSPLSFPLRASIYCVSTPYNFVLSSDSHQTQSSVVHKILIFIPKKNPVLVVVCFKRLTSSLSFSSMGQLPSAHLPELLSVFLCQVLSAYGLGTLLASSESEMTCVH